ncbi:hypothetical protein LCGC14_3058320, partial [marine sediment metagenome]
MGISNTDYLKLLDRLFEAERYFTGEEYRSIVSRARQLFNSDGFDLCVGELDKLPSSGVLLERLVKKLKGKSISRTLKKIQEGKVEDSLTTAKGLSSLLTHIFIECEKGNTEYKILVPNIV